MTPQKKKPRQRNRPKNKANRPNDVLETENANLEPQQINQINKRESEDLILKPHTPPIQMNLKENSLSETLKSNSENRLATETMYEKHQAMKFIQQQMRLKFLKNKKINEKVFEQQQKNLNETKNAQVKVENLKTTNNNNLESTTSITALKQHKKPKIIKKENNTNNNNNETVATTTTPTTTNTKITTENSQEKIAFIANLQKQMETVMAKGNTDLPQTLLGNLQKLLDQEPISDVESSDDEAEYIEYVYKPRQYFISTLCNLCKIDLLKAENKIFPCKRCNLTYYCSMEHMKSDKAHRQLCNGLKQIAEGCGGHIFYKCGDFSTDQFRSYRIVTIRSVESIINRTLSAEEQEIILFPRICSEPKCREYQFRKLKDCEKCGQIAYCKENEAHFPLSHQRWCRPFQIFKELIIFQTKFGRLDPSLPNKILKDLPGACCNTKQILHKLHFDVTDPCEYAALSQITTGPLTAWYALKLCGSLKKADGILTIHLIGAEIEFEVDLLHKWELFFLHITPAIKELHVIFIGPELNSRNISFDQLKKTKCCRSCRKLGRTVHYHFECQLYHSYCELQNFKTPDLICFFNAGLYRATGYQLEDTWPDTILAAANIKCPIVVTSYTEYEAPLDMTRFVQESNRHLNVVLPPIVNSFASEKPERNFVSDDEAPLIFKNFYCFVIE